MLEFKVTIDRFDGQQAYISYYNCSYNEQGTMLDLLQHIKEEHDSTLAFTANCRSAICGACAVRVNDRAVLACSTLLADMTQLFHTNKLYIQPLANYKIIRDLVVDWEPKVTRLTKVEPWLVPSKKYTKQNPALQTQGELAKFHSDTNCILCGICASSCNKLSANGKDFYEPYVYSKAHRMLSDSRHCQGKNQLQAVMDKGLWKCMHCQECVSSCPQGVSPAQDIALMRAASIKVSKNNLGARHALAFYNDIRNLGRLDETFLAPKTEGLLKAATRLSTALKLLRRGKLKLLPIPKKIKEIKQVRILLSELAHKEGK